MQELVKNGLRLFEFQDIELIFRLLNLLLLNFLFQRIELGQNLQKQEIEG